jgi:hypothetical protein
MHKKKQQFLLSLLVLISLAFQLEGSTGCSWFRGDEAGKIKLAWDENKEADVTGYKVYYGTAPGKYGPGIDVGNFTNFTLDGLVKGQTYYVAIRAYTKSGQESAFSREASGVAK